MGKRKQEKRLQAIKAKAAAQRTKPDPWEIVVFRGWHMSRYTAAAIRVLEEKLGFELTLLQGPFNAGGVGGSAGTHDEDGVVDLSSWRARRKCAVSRLNHWASWVRPLNWDGAGGIKHVHQCLKRAQPMASLAVSQLEVDYPARRDGLASHAVDHFVPHPELERFDYNEWWHDRLLDERIKGITATINRLLDQVAAKRAQRQRLRHQKSH